MKVFALRLVLKQRHKRTLKLLVEFYMTIAGLYYTTVII